MTSLRGVATATDAYALLAPYRKRVGRSRGSAGGTRTRGLMTSRRSHAAPSLIPRTIRRRTILDVVRTRIYLAGAPPHDLRVAALTDKVKMNDLLVDGVKQLLDARPAPDALARLLRAEVEALKPRPSRTPPNGTPAGAGAGHAGQGRGLLQRRRLPQGRRATPKRSPSGTSSWTTRPPSSGSRDAPMTADEVFRRSIPR